MIALEIFGIPFREIKPVAPACVARCFTANPWRDETVWQRREIVAQDAEGFRRDFDVRAAEDARVVEAVGVDRGQVFVKVDVGIEDGTVVLAGSDKRDCLDAKLEVVGILRMKSNGEDAVQLRLRCAMSKRRYQDR